MADVGLDGADQERARRFTACALTSHPQRRTQRLDFDWVAQCGSRAVGLHVLHIAGREAGIGQRRTHDGDLRRAVGGGDAVAAPVLVECRAAQNGQNCIFVGYGIAKSFQHDHAAAFAAHEPVGARVKRLAAPITRHHPRPGEGDGRHWREDRVDAARQRRPALTGAQTLHGQVDGHQG